MTTLKFFVHGPPAWYRRPNPGSPRGGRRGNVTANPKADAWKRAVRAAALAAMELTTPPEAPLFAPRLPLFLSVWFYLQRPKSHYTATGALKKAAPRFPSQRGTGDFDNLAKEVADALEKWPDRNSLPIAYLDDAQIVRSPISKDWAQEKAGLPVGAKVFVYPLEEKIERPHLGPGEPPQGSWAYENDRISREQSQET